MLPGKQLNQKQMAYVLLVEDEPLIRVLLAEELREVGLHVIETSNADEAWSYLEAGGEVDLVFSDMAMPGSMSGVELMKRVRDAYPGIKRVLTSGNPGPGNISELGLFLPKPYRLDMATRMTLNILGLNVS
jgi:CheY-like chemotaxis protein